MHGPQQNQPPAQQNQSPPQQNPAVHSPAQSSVPRGQPAQPLPQQKQIKPVFNEHSNFRNPAAPHITFGPFKPQTNFMRNKQMETVAQPQLNNVPNVQGGQQPVNNLPNTAANNTGMAPIQPMNGGFNNQANLDGYSTMTGYTSRFNTRINDPFQPTYDNQSLYTQNSISRYLSNNPITDYYTPLSTVGTTNGFPLSGSKKIPWLYWECNFPFSRTMKSLAPDVNRSNTLNNKVAPANRMIQHGNSLIEVRKKCITTKPIILVYVGPKTAQYEAVWQNLWDTDESFRNKIETYNEEARAMLATMYNASIETIKKVESMIIANYIKINEDKLMRLEDNDDFTPLDTFSRKKQKRQLIGQIYEPAIYDQDCYTKFMLIRDFLGDTNTELVPKQKPRRTRGKKKSQKKYEDDNEYDDDYDDYDDDEYDDFDPLDYSGPLDVYDYEDDYE